MLKTGQLYQHYKGHIYRIIGIARHSETLEEMVVYVSNENEADLWVRPRVMFEETLPNGTPRFKLKD